MANAALTRPEVTAELILTTDEALALLKFLKRSGFNDFLQKCDQGNGNAEAYEMMYAAEKIREAVAATRPYLAVQ